MSSDFPRRPTVLRGALVAYASAFLGPVPNVIVFQYNPDSLTRTLRHRVEQRPGTAAAGRAAAGDPVKVTGPPEETLTLTVSLDATDDLEDGEPLAVAVGLHPVLAALELLLYPDSMQVLRNQTLAAAGAASTPPAEVPTVLLVWGAGRVVPVRIDAMSITETAHDPRLNPIRADVELTLQVLTYLDLPGGSLGHGASLAHHVAKEVVARLNLVDTAVTAVGEVL